MNNQMIHLISEMKRVYDLELQESNLTQRNMLDSKIIDQIDELNIFFAELMNAYNLAGFRIHKISLEKLTDIFNRYKDILKRDIMYSNEIRNIESEKNIIQNSIHEEWKTYYNFVSLPRLQLLDTVKEISNDKQKVIYTIGKLKKGMYWCSKESDLKVFAAGIIEADDLQNNLKIKQHEVEFLNKVVKGEASILDLTEEILIWITDSDIAGKLKIKFDSI